MKNQLTGTIKIKTVTPVFIGSGKTFEVQKDFFVNGDGLALNLVNRRQLEQLIYRNGLSDDYSQHIFEKEQITLDEWLNTQEEFRDKVLKEFEIRTLPVEDSIKDIHQIRSVGAFVRDVYGKPYIPGSSLKGVIKNILKSYVLINSQSDQGFFETKRQQIKNVMKANEWNAKQRIQNLGKKLDDYLEKQLFSNFNTRCFLPSPILIRDSNAIGEEEHSLVICQKNDYILGSDQATNPVNVYRECLRENTEFTFQIKVDFDRINGITNVEALKTALSTQKQLLLNVNGIYADFYQEIENFIPEQIKQDQDNTIFIFLGGGVGFHSKTLLAALFYEDNDFREIAHYILNLTYKRDEEVFAPHTIKLANDKMMGICRLELEDVDNA